MDWETIKLVGAIIMFAIFILALAAGITWCFWMLVNDGRDNK